MPRLRCFRFAVAMVGLLVGFGGVAAAPALADPPEKIYLHKNWELQSSCEVKASGAQVSAVGFDASGWHHADMPSTVVGALVDGQDVPRSDLRDEPEVAAGDGLLVEDVFCVAGHAEGQPVPLLVVVSDGICGAGGVRAEGKMAAFSGHQLSSQRVDQWKEGSGCQGSGGDVCDV